MNLPPAHDVLDHVQYHESEPGADRGLGDELYHGPFSEEPFHGNPGGAGAEMGPTSEDISVSVARLTFLTLFVTTLVMVPATYLAEMMNGASTGLHPLLSPPFWLAMTFFMCIMYFLTREWEGLREGRVIRHRPGSEARVR